MGASHEQWKHLAGSAYGGLMSSKESAMAGLNDADSNVRIAAIHICGTNWDCSKDPAFADACRALAETDQSDAVRYHAIGALGHSFRSSQDPTISRFLADLATHDKAAEDVRQAAYWALREIQTGLNDEDLVKQFIRVTKAVVCRMPPHKAKQHLNETLRVLSQVSDLDWESGDQIDWEFVSRFVSHS